MAQQAGSSLSQMASQSTIDNKILADLDLLCEKMDLCDSMLRPTSLGDPAPSVKRHEALLAVIGYLEACAPRMVELVQAAAQGALSENVLEKCLEVNDRLIKQLAEIDTISMTETPASTTAASVPKKELDGLNLIDDESDRSLGAKQSSYAGFAKGSSGGKSTGEDDEEDPFRLKAATTPAVPTGKSTGMAATSSDPFGNQVLAPAQADSVPPAAIPPRDEFDAFFEERTADKKD